MARFYGLPARGIVGMTDAHDIDFQAGAESMLHFMHADLFLLM
jgi:trimethylamine--corrinoid protein Co-methyltransferase